jgi:hypothetical protein
MVCRRLFCRKESRQLVPLKRHLGIDGFASL